VRAFTLTPPPPPPPAPSPLQQALPRDLTLDPQGTGLLQQFSPELAALRLPTPPPARSQQVEVVVDFVLHAGSEGAVFGVNVLASADGQDATAIGVSLADGQVFAHDRAGPLVFDPAAPATVHLHAVVDHSIVTVIVNNRTAITRYVTPRDANSDGVELFGVDGTTITATVAVWQLASI
jgi:sucrose-6-phosphate hydrolase SacC (GH32 family)